MLSCVFNREAIKKKKKIASWESVTETSHSCGFLNYVCIHKKIITKKGYSDNVRYYDGHCEKTSCGE